MISKPIELEVRAAPLLVMQLAQVPLARYARVSFGEIHVLLDGSRVAGVLLTGGEAGSRLSELLAAPAPRATRLVFTDEPSLPEGADGTISVAEAILRVMVTHDEDALHDAITQPIRFK